MKIVGSEDLVSYFNHRNYSTLEFLKGGKLKLSNTLIKEWIVDIKKGVYSWSFDPKDKLLRIFFNNQIIAALLPLRTEVVVVKTKNADQTKVKCTAVIFKRVKF